VPAGEHTVEVAGAELSCLVDSVSIAHGRDDPGSQPAASSATVDITVTPGWPLPATVEIGAALVVDTTTPGGSFRRFAGRITDIALAWDDAGEATPDAGTGQIVAVGPIADLGRAVVGDIPFPLELDGARVGRVLAAAGVTLDPAFSDPGTVDILARDIDSTAALDAAHDAASSASGVLWETRAGEIRYADADHRRGVPSSLTLDACDVLVTPTWRRTLEGLVNYVSIGYGVAPDGGEAPRFVESSPESITRYGRYAYDSTTALAALADAQEVGRLLLARNNSPVWVMSSLPVDATGLDAARYDALLGLDVHALVTLTGLPAIGSAPTAANLWVEGWHETLTYGGHDVELVVSGYCRTVPPPTWNDLDPSWTWGTSTLTETRRNLITNPSFETDTTGWAAWGVGTLLARQGSSSSPVGGFYLRCTTNDAANTGAAMALAATPGVNYGARAMTRLNAALGVACRLQFLDAGGAQTGIVSGTTITHPTSAWGLNVVEGGAPAGTTQMRVLVNRRVAGAAGQFLDVDAVAAYAGGIGDAAYFDGDTLDTNAIDYAWADVPHASESVQSDIATSGDGLPPELTWDGATCLGPPINVGRWDDQPATLRWDQIAPAITWDTYPATG